jgi:hypothetical protein
MTPSHPSTRYSFGFLGVSLRPDLARVVAEIFLQERSWPTTRARVLATNALQCRTPLSSRRLEHELRLRLSTLTPAQLALLVDSAGPDRTALSWLSALKQSTLLFDFAADLLREKLSGTDHVLRYSDYETFVDSRVVTHPELGDLKPSTRGKLRQMLMHMLAEASLIQRRGKEQIISRPPVGRAVVEVVAADDARWLAGFLYTDDEIGALRCR